MTYHSFIVGYALPNGGASNFVQVTVDKPNAELAKAEALKDLPQGTTTWYTQYKGMRAEKIAPFKPNPNHRNI